MSAALRVGLVGLIASGHSGIPRYAAALTAGLDRVAREFPELSLRLLSTEAGARESRARQIEVQLVRGPFPRADGGARRVIAEQLAVRGMDCDLLHFFDLAGPVLASHRRFVATVHDAAVRHDFERVRIAHKRMMQPWAVRHAARMVAVSRFAKEEAVRMFGAQAQRIEVIRSGPGLVSAHGGQPTVLTMPYLLYVGNIAAHKNLPFLIKAFSAADLDARLVLVGRRGERFDEVRAAIDSSSAQSRIELRRNASDAEVDRLYRGAIALLLPSLYEGFGFTALEAMTRGCPVLASDIPALREICGDGAWLLGSDDHAAWGSAMAEVLRDPRRRAELADRGRAAVGRYSWDETARCVCSLFLRQATT